jgi:GNAT superfamily N-acetyltransferase
VTPLAPGFHPVPRGMVATVVTYLEMTAPAPPRTAPDLPGIGFAPLDPDLTVYRDLFARVGAQDWLWFSRMQMPDDDLAAILAHDDVTLHTLLRDGHPEALLELDFRETGACELAFFGVSPALMGTGAGRVLMNHALRLAWARDIARFHVHTCTMDHPGALDFYRRSGFSPVRQEVEIAPDPRLTGVLPETAGPHVPIFP